MEISRRKMVSATALTLLTAGCTTSASNPRLMMDATVETQPTEPLTLGLEILDPEITAETSGKLAVTYKNTGDEQVTLKLHPPEPHPQTSEDDSPGIVLYDTAASVNGEEDGFWMPTADRVSSTLGKPDHHLSPDEEATAEYQLWAHPQGKPEYNALKSGTFQVPMPESAALQIVLSEG